MCDRISHNVGTSFRDPVGCLLHHRGRVIRIVNAEGLDLLKEYLDSSEVNRLVNAGYTVRTLVVQEEEVQDLLAEANSELQ